jgi:hypothetical protein
MELAMEAEALEAADVPEGTLMLTSRSVIAIAKTGGLAS